MTDNCKAKRYGDQMMCECGLAWDVDDSEPPRCRADRHLEKRRDVERREAMEKIWRALE